MPDLCLPPCDIAAEQAVLGALIADNWLYRTSRFLSPDDFCDPVHADIYAAIVRRLVAGLPADAKALREEFAGQLAEVGGAAHLDDCPRAFGIDAFTQLDKLRV